MAMESHESTDVEKWKLISSGKEYKECEFVTTKVLRNSCSIFHFIRMIIHQLL